VSAAPAPAAQAGADPEAQPGATSFEMRRAFEAMRRAGWPTTLAEALANPVFRAELLMHARLLRVGRDPWARTVIRCHAQRGYEQAPDLRLVPRATGPAFDHKRAAAGDFDD